MIIDKVSLLLNREDVPDDLVFAGFMNTILSGEPQDKMIFEYERDLRVSPEDAATKAVYSLWNSMDGCYAEIKAIIIYREHKDAVQRKDTFYFSQKEFDVFYMEQFEENAHDEQ